jgi:hypothetical protein
MRRQPQLDRRPLAADVDQVRLKILAALRVGRGEPIDHRKQASFEKLQCRQLLVQNRLIGDARLCNSGSYGVFSGDCRSASWPGVSGR